MSPYEEFFFTALHTPITFSSAIVENIIKTVNGTSLDLFDYVSH